MPHKKASDKIPVYDSNECYTLTKKILMIPC